MADPFFTLPESSDWNACIGKQGDELNHLDGYIEAALALADGVIEQKQWERRDTLVLPILYNARHAVELLLKFAINQLVGAGVMPKGHRPNHDIRGHYDLMVKSDIGDEAVRGLLQKLEPFVRSLCRLDDDGQQLRYHQTQDGKQSLAGQSLMNLEVIRGDLEVLKTLIDQFIHRVVALVDERRTGTHTTKCSREDLFVIARMLPKRRLWDSIGFGLAKADINARFALTKTQFSKAQTRIQSNREIMGSLGVEAALTHLSDDRALLVFEAWRTAHPPSGDDGKVVSISFGNLDRILAGGKRKAEALDKLKVLSTDDIADLSALNSIGQLGVFGEEYEAALSRVKRGQALGDDPQKELARLIDKLSLPYTMHVAATKLGRTSLAAALKDRIGNMRPKSA
jgi:hypothetical protein